MNNNKQISVILFSLKLQREKYLCEVVKLNKSINIKRNLIARMATYSDEYQDISNLSSSRSIPSLNKNIYQFIDQVEDVIQKTKVEISKLIQIRDVIIQKYLDSNNKLNMMIEVEKSTFIIQTIKNENFEQLSIDDLSSLKSIRNKYE